MSGLIGLNAVWGRLPEGRRHVRAEGLGIEVFHMGNKIVLCCHKWFDGFPGFFLQKFDDLKIKGVKHGNRKGVRFAVVEKREERISTRNRFRNKVNDIRRYGFPLKGDKRNA